MTVGSCESCIDQNVVVGVCVNPGLVLHSHSHSTLKSIVSSVSQMPLEAVPPA